MSVPVIKRGLMNYISTNVFINPLNIPVYQKKDSSSDLESDQLYEEKMKILSQKLDILMKIPHQEFWCHVVYDTSILLSLQSFCNNATRSYELILDRTELGKSQKALHNKYFLLILRLTSNKEVNITEFSKTNYGDLIYDNFIVDIPLLFDICSIYGDDNSEIIGKMIMHIFSCQSLYEDDFRSYALQTLKQIEEKIYFITSNVKHKKDIHNLKTNVLSEEFTNDFLFYMIDILHSWNNMLQAVCSKSQIFEMLNQISFPRSLEQMFEKLVPFMQEKIDKFETTDPDRLKHLLSVFCFNLINLWRKIFKGYFLDKLLSDNGSSVSSASSSEEKFLLIRECISVINSCQDNPIFADAMYLMFPLQDDFDVILHAVSQDKHEYYSDFVNLSLTSISKDIDGRKTIFSSKSVPESKTYEDSKDRTSTDQLSDIKFIVDIFPDLLEKEIRTYLKCYQCSPEHMLESLLAGAIDIDFVKKTAVQESNDTSLVTDVINRNVLANHRNIYDGDDLDTGRVDASQLHLGKRQVKLTSFVDSALKSTIMGIVQKQNEEERERDVLQFNPNLTYDDEFDDFYGISHDGIVVDSNKTSEEVNIQKCSPIVDSITKNSNSENLSQRDKGTINDFVEDKGEIMEPSKLKFTQYDKRQFEKKKYQDNAIGLQNGENGLGPVSKRQGSHAPKDIGFKKDRRPKYERNKLNKAA